MTTTTAPPAPRALETVRALERTLLVEEHAESFSEERLREARRDADELLVGARVRGRELAEEVRHGLLVTADRDVAALLDAADSEIAALRATLAEMRASLLDELRELLLPPTARGGR